MSEKEKTKKELIEKEKDFEKKCELVKKQLQRMEREAKKPIPRWLWEWKVTI